MIKAKITRCNNLKMDGAELKRLRTAAKLTQLELAEGMKEWGWTRDRIAYLESLSAFELVPPEMQALLTALNASSI